MTKGEKVLIPVDYVLAPTEEIADQLIAQGVLTPGMDQYGGADISIATDGANTEYVAFCAKKISTGVFAFFVLDITHGNAEVAYRPICTGRGEVNNGGKWIAWKEKEYFKGMIPGFVPHKNNDAELVAIRQQQVEIETALAAIRQQLVGIETALGNISAGGLSEEDQRALAFLRDLAGALDRLRG